MWYKVLKVASMPPRVLAVSCRRRRSIFTTSMAGTFWNPVILHLTRPVARASLMNAMNCVASLGELRCHRRCSHVCLGWVVEWGRTHLGLAWIRVSFGFCSIQLCCMSHTTADEDWVPFLAKSPETLGTKGKFGGIWPFLNMRVFFLENFMQCHNVYFQYDKTLWNLHFFSYNCFSSKCSWADDYGTCKMIRSEEKKHGALSMMGNLNKFKGPTPPMPRFPFQEIWPC